jgi:hypothetical protein
MFDLTDPLEELFDDLNSEILLDSPDDMSIALVDQTAGLIYDLDDGEIANLTNTFWDTNSAFQVTGLSFDAMRDVLGVATTDELIVFDAMINHLETDRFDPANCAGDSGAHPTISRGAGIGYYKSDCGSPGASETIFWFDL